MNFVGLIGWLWIALNKDDCAYGMDHVLQCLTQEGCRRATGHDQCDHMMCATTMDICTHNTATIALWKWTDSHFTSPTASVPKSSLRGPEALSLVRTQGVALTFIGGKSEDQNKGGGTQNNGQLFLHRYLARETVQTSLTCGGTWEYQAFNGARKCDATDLCVAAKKIS